MAITKIHPITTTLTKALNYIQNPKKTDGTLLVDGYGCVPETAYQQFMRTKEKVDKINGNLAFHLIQSFSPGEVDYETAHKIGIELADKVFRGKFQYVIATHIDRGNVHNHIIANSVSFKDYKKFHSTASTLRYIRRTNDMLCTEYGLSVVAEPNLYLYWLFSYRHRFFFQAVSLIQVQIMYQAQTQNLKQALPQV